MGQAIAWKTAPVKRNKEITRKKSTEQKVKIAF